MRRASTLIFTIAALGLGACGGESSSDSSQSSRSAGPSAEVEIKTFMFQPDPVEVERGTEVRWANTDGTVHTVTSGSRERPDGRFDASLAADGGTFAHRFDQPGRYSYVCTRHSGPGMEGEVIVR